MRDKVGPVELVLRTGMEGWTKEKMWKAVAMLTSHSTSIASDNARARIHFFETFKGLSTDEMVQQLVVSADDHVHFEDTGTAGKIVSEEA